jgi:hypothetical protein
MAERVSILLKYGARSDIALPDRRGRTPIDIATITGALPEVRYMLIMMLWENIPQHTDTVDFGCGSQSRLERFNEKVTLLLAEGRGLHLSGQIEVVGHRKAGGGHHALDKPKEVEGLGGQKLVLNSTKPPS